MMARALILLILAGAAAGRAAAVERGRDLFARRCSGCHAPDRNIVGPRLRGVFGRKAATVAGFPYSGGLKNSHLTWDEQSLDRWLTAPDKVVPETGMEFSVPKADERAAIIAYLKSLGSEH